MTVVDALQVHDVVTVTSVTGIELANRFVADPDLRSAASILAQAHGLVVTTVMPTIVLSDLLAAIDPLEQWIGRRTPHLRAWAQ